MSLNAEFSAAVLGHLGHSRVNFILESLRDNRGRTWSKRSDDANYTAGVTDILSEEVRTGRIEVVYINALMGTKKAFISFW